MLVYYCCSHNATTEPTSVTQDSTDTIEPRPPGIPVREFLPGIAEPKIPGGNSREFLKFWRELRGIYRSCEVLPSCLLLLLNPGW